MCGISGIVAKPNHTVEPDIIKKMNALIAHRGPDGEGFYQHEQTFLGHRRLAILDLSDQGKQPMHWKDQYVISFNGEVYNYLEIRDELKLAGYAFNSECDTEVILAAYAHWGEACVERFNGMWAFAIHDKVRNQVFCSRDRFGIKPFYYLDSESCFAFGSEIKQLLFLQKEVKVCKDVILEFLITGLEDCTDQTFFKDILKLPGGHNLSIDLHDGSIKIQPYYHINFESEHAGNLEDCVTEYRNSLEQAVRFRMRSDVKVGTCLSGGLDSSSIAAMASKMYEGDGNFTAIHAKSEEAETDESLFAKDVAEHCELDLHVIEPSYDDFVAHLKDVIYTQEEPFGSASVAMQYFVLKHARSINCIVMLDGQGGDETLLGYEKYYPAYLKNQGRLALIKNTLKSSKNSKLSLSKAIQFQLYFTNYKLRLKRLKRKNGFVKQTLLNAFKSEPLKAMAGAYKDIKSLQKQEILSTQLPHLLKYEDKNAMRHGVETRLPFIDYNTLETAINTNDNYKIHEGWTKYILRKVVDPILPKSIVWRKNKLGFNAPEGIWLKKHGQVMEEAVINSKLLDNLVDKKSLAFKNLPLRTQWKLYNIAVWEELYHISPEI